MNKAIESVNERYFKASPEFCDLDTDEGGKKFFEHVSTALSGIVPHALILDIADCYLDYWGCAPLLEGAIRLISDPQKKELRTLAILTTMEFGARTSYASLFFKGTEFEKHSASKDFIDIAHKACLEASVELKIWTVPFQGFIFESLGSLRAPNFVLSSR